MKTDTPTRTGIAAHYSGMKRRLNILLTSTLAGAALAGSILPATPAAAAPPTMGVCSAAYDRLAEYKGLSDVVADSVMVSRQTLIDAEAARTWTQAQVDAAKQNISDWTWATAQTASARTGMVATSNRTARCKPKTRYAYVRPGASVIADIRRLHSESTGLANWLKPYVADLNARIARLDGQDPATFVEAPVVAPPLTGPGVSCMQGDPTDPVALTNFFAQNNVAGISGSDYPRPIELGGGRRLWAFQDVFFGRDNSLWGDAFAHNTALIQHGNCFKLVVPRGQTWLKVPGDRELWKWGWITDGEIGADGLLHLFVAVVSNPTGKGAAAPALPQSMMRYVVDPNTFAVIGSGPAGDPNGQLFGWSVVSDANYSYLYGHCYRQWAPGTYIGHDTSCTNSTMVARVPRGHFEMPYEYADGSGGWTTDPWGARVVHDGGWFRVNPIATPLSVEYVGDRYVAISKIDDWWGDRMVAYTSASPVGPWTVAGEYPIATRCGTGCNTYGASIVASASTPGRVLVAYSNNAWKMIPDAYNNGSLYRVGFVALPV